MADEVVRLGVDPTPAEEGYRRYEQAAESAIRTTDRLSASVDAYERGVRERLSSADIEAAVRRYDSAYGDVAETVESVGTSSSTATAGLSRLNYSLASVARQAAGVHPVVGQLASTVSTFAVGSAVTVGVLAGLAAIATAIRVIGREAREAEERLSDARTALDRLAPDTGVGESVATVQARFDENVARLNQLRDPDYIRQQLQSVSDPSGMLQRLEAERDELFQQNMADAERLARGRAAIEEAQGEERVERAKALQEQIGFAMAEVDERITAQILENRRQAEVAYQQRIGTEIREQAQRNLTGPPGFDATSLDFQKRAEEEQLRLKEEQARATERLVNLERERLRAQIGLIYAIREVGSVLGGDVGQIASIISSTMALQGMPGFGDENMWGRGEGFMGFSGDAWRGYGASALTGVGYGTSTGSPALGALGGGLSGFAAAGPAGAIVGAVGGIVSGLIEQGKRAQEARRLWQRAFEDFALMFDEMTPFEQDIESLNRRFEQLSGGRTREEVEQKVEDLREILEGSRDPRSVFFGSLPANNRIGIELQIERYEELLRVYDENAEQARELAEAERDLYQSRTSALNAPDGLRLSLLEWRASGASSPRFDPFAPPGTEGAPNGPTYITGDVTINVTSSDPDHAGHMVRDALTRDSLRGGASLLTVPYR